MLEKNITRMGKPACPVFLAVDVCILEFGIHELAFFKSVSDMFKKVRYMFSGHLCSIDIATGVLRGDPQVSLRGQTVTGHPQHNQIFTTLGHGRIDFPWS